MTIPQTSSARKTKTARLGLRATPEQERLLRRAAEVSRKSLTEFIMDSAYRAAEETLLDQRLFLVDEDRYRSLLELLDRPASDNSGLRDLFAKKAPWDEK